MEQKIENNVTLIDQTIGNLNKMREQAIRLKSSPMTDDDKFTAVVGARVLLADMLGGTAKLFSELTAREAQAEQEQDKAAAEAQQEQAATEVRNSAMKEEMEGATTDEVPTA